MSLSGNNGLSGNANGFDIVGAAAAGGEKFLDNLRALSQVQVAAKTAYDNLNLGMAAKAMLDEAERISTETKTARDEATAKLSAEVTATRERVTRETDAMMARAVAIEADADNKLKRAAVLMAKLPELERQAAEITGSAAKKASAILRDAFRAAADALDRA